jgi:hypothetical protein
MKQIFILFFSVYSSAAQCQTEKANYDQISSWSANFGTSLFYNSAVLNFETRNLLKPSNLKNQLHFSAGAGYFNFFLLSKTTGITLPVYATYLRGAGKNHFEMDLGINFFFNKQGYPLQTKFVRPLPRIFIGYRYQNPIYPFWFKAGIGLLEAVQIGFGYRL